MAGCAFAETEVSAPDAQSLSKRKELSPVVYISEKKIKKAVLHKLLGLYKTAYIVAKGSKQRSANVSTPP